jgi:hypothetical protein
MAASKPTGVHYALIIFVMLTLTFGVMAFMFSKQTNELKSLREQAETKARDLTTANTTLDQQLQALKTLVGHNFETVVNASNPGDTNTVSGAVAADLQLAGDPPQTTLSGAIHAMAARINDLTADRDKRKAELDETNRALLALQNENQKRIEEEVKARNNSETVLQNRIQTIDDEIKVKDDLIATLEKDKLNLESQLDTEIATRATEVRDREKTISNLKGVASDLQTELDKTRQISFEVSDGLIVSVDNLTRTAYVNLGKADGLPLRTSFSVYTKANRGVARGKDDIKGAIEITQHIGPHLSVARILDDDIYNPIAPGDPIYTPMWHIGQKSAFSIVGAIDLDGDGQSDRELFREIVKASGAQIDNEVDDEGNLKGDGITIKTRFLIIADVPSDPPSSPMKRKIFDQIKQQQLNLTNQARERGIRVVTLDNFLNFIGYRPTHFIYKPGVERKGGVLKSGSVSKRADGIDTGKLGTSGTQLQGMDRRDKPNVREQPVPGQRTFIK